VDQGSRIARQLLAWGEPSATLVEQQHAVSLERVPNPATGTKRARPAVSEGSLLKHEVEQIVPFATRAGTLADEDNDLLIRVRRREHPGI
jgi:hypothetical protein